MERECNVSAALQAARYGQRTLEVQENALISVKAEGDWSNIVQT